MIVRAVYRVERAGYDIYIELRRDGDTRWYQAPYPDGGMGVIEVAPGCEAPRYTFIQEAIADALAEASGRVRRPRSDT